MRTKASASRLLAQFLAARAGAISAQQMLMLAVSWHMYELTLSAWYLGLVGLFQFVPGLGTTFLAGHCADRLHRGRIVAACLVGQAVVAAVLAAATTTQVVTRDLLLALSLLLGAIRPFQMAGQQALLPMLVPQNLLARAMALSTVVQQVCVIVGPALGGLLFATGINALYLTCAALFCTSAVMYALIRYDYVAPPREPVTTDSVLAGLRFVWSHPLLLGGISLDLFAVLFGGATALLPVYAKELLHVGPQGLGLLRSAPAVGALAVGLVLSRRAIGNGVGKKLLVAVATYGVCIAAFGLSRSFLLSLALLAISGAADTVSVVVRQTLIQLETPDRMRGRVAAVNTLFVGASNQLGEFESGLSATALGPVASVVAGGCATVLVSIAWSRFFRPLAERDTLHGGSGTA
ncbi:MFS transporter [Burkholderia multivorans]|uniref:MFS transporter n=1 Tax=Burkholderia multivorans TaxID=87883 RepID=UPI000D34BCAA|nr:MFS transporter [Burkholderia multivorans]MBR8017811.1 MFS transporter [Burkholderia multivorans]MEB2508972.1 MFS transporter [Burkholderia multivorans]MEB2520063.1 MFS transporter [Burkholderia multivorans]MEB2572548.1 MFS transporter [Burkholderia multivorans]MEB2590398.1 MFS transporter [Burkholderia multivorans]